MRDIRAFATLFPKAGVGALAASALALSACGGGGGNSTTPTAASNSGGVPAGGPFASLTADERSCVQKQGVRLPAGRPGGRRPNGGQPPNGGNGQRRARDPSRFQELRDAMQKCGIQLPARPPGGGPPSQAGANPGTAQN